MVTTLLNETICPINDGDDDIKQEGMCAKREKVKSKICSKRGFCPNEIVQIGKCCHFLFTYYSQVLGCGDGILGWLLLILSLLLLKVVV